MGLFKPPIGNLPLSSFKFSEVYHYTVLNGTLKSILTSNPACRGQYRSEPRVGPLKLISLRHSWLHLSWPDHRGSDSEIYNGDSRKPELRCEYGVRVSLVTILPARQGRKHGRAQGHALGGLSVSSVPRKRASGFCHENPCIPPIRAGTSRPFLPPILNTVF